MAFSAGALTPAQMVNQIQTTLAIEIIYYFLINAIKISILCFYLRIGKSSQYFGQDQADRLDSCWQTTRSTQQRHHLLPGHFLLHLRNLLPHAMHTTTQDVGPHRTCRGQVY